jgi:Ser/Thr protein kinase RdoA (MazF antagonist)
MPALADTGPDALLATTAPQATEEDAHRIAAEAFGIAAEVRLLTSERDKNFHLRASNGSEFVLKVANAAEDPDVSNLQTMALRHLASHDPGLPVPRVCAALDGQFETIARLRDGSRHLVRLLTFLPGEPQYRTRASIAQAAELGRLLAAIGLALRDFRHKAASHELLWDLKHASKLHRLLPFIEAERCQTLATAALDRYEHHVRPRQAGLRAQVVHNDFNPHNVLVDPVDPTRVTGVLDFGDMVQTPLVHDVAVAASYQVEGEGWLERTTAFVAAYHSVYPLQAEEIDSLFDLIALRHVMTVAITSWRASLYPDNKAYILRNQPRAAAALEILDRLGRDSGRAHLRQACKVE